MRIINGRYLAFAAALLAVWLLLGRSRTAQPQLDESWTPVVANESSVPSLSDGTEPVSACQSSEECSLELARTDERTQPSVTANVEQQDLDQQSLSSADWQLESEQVESVAAPESTKSELSSADLLYSEAIEEQNNEEQNNEEQNNEEQDNSEFVVTALRSIADEKLAGSKAVKWQKNPYSDAPIKMKSDEATPDQASPASFEPKADSVLDLGLIPNVDTSFHDGEFAQLKPSQPDVAPVSGALTESVAQQAVHHIEYGKSLSRRGASFGARQEFFSALGVIAQGNDVQTGGNAHTTALRRALRAMREAEDFAVGEMDTQARAKVSEILETHQTRIISPNEAYMMTPVHAMQRYFTFAHQQLDFAGGQNVVVAEALYCLGKLHTVLAKHQPETLDVAKAIVFHRSALSNDSQNFRSYNELGVLLARSGQLSEAEGLFKKSLRIRPSSKTWQNLATTHGRQGELELAQLAQTEFAIAAQTDVAQSALAQISWLPQQDFNQVGPADFQESTKSTSAVANAVAPASRTAALADGTDDEKSEKKSFAERFNLKKWF